MMRKGANISTTRARWHGGSFHRFDSSGARRNLEQLEPRSSHLRVHPATPQRLWKLYPREELERRRNIVRVTRELLDKLTDTLDSAPLGETNSAPTEAKAAPVRPPRPRVEVPVSLDQDIMFLKGVGEKRAKLMAKWGVHTVSDLLHHFPHRYEDRRFTRHIADLEIGDKDSFLCEVIAEPQTRMMGHRNLTKVRVGDSTGRVDLSWWNQPFRDKQFKVGSEAVRLRQNQRVRRRPPGRCPRI